MFRHEKPQKGRYRQFNQFGIEYFGFNDTNSDLELIILGGHVFDKLGLKNIKLHINSLGDKNDKNKYAEIVTKFFKSIKSKLDDYQLNTLNKNPLRLLDSKKDNIKDILEQIPSMTETLSNESKTRCYDCSCKIYSNGK